MMLLCLISFLRCIIGDFESINVKEGHVKHIFKQPYTFTKNDTKVSYHNNKNGEHITTKNCISKNLFCNILNLIYMVSIILVISLGILLQPELVITVTIGHIIIVLFCHWYFCIRHYNND